MSTSIGTGRLHEGGLDCRNLCEICGTSREQPGGNHYKQMAIQPVQYIHANGLGYCEANIVKYVSRWRDKNGIEDLLKARHYIDLLIELEGLEKAEFGQQNTIDCRTDEQKGFNDPRTVAGVDVAFETEKHMNFAPECEHNFEDHGSYRFGSRGQQLTILNCGKCGAEQVEAEDEWLIQSGLIASSGESADRSGQAGLPDQVEGARPQGAGEAEAGQRTAGSCSGECAACRCGSSEGEGE